MITILTNIFVALVALTFMFLWYRRTLKKPYRKFCIKKFDACVNGKIVSFNDTTISTPTQVVVFIHNGEVKTVLHGHEIPEGAIILCHIEESKI